MSLRSQFDILLARAQVQGRATLNLQGGAAMAVKVRAGRIQLIISRVGPPLGVDEIATFHAHCNVPADAIRYPAEGQSRRGRRWRVAWAWEYKRLELEEVEVPQPALFDLPPPVERRGDEPPV